jgi:hypothetical protein
MGRWWRRGLILSVAVGWATAGLLAWLLVARVGPLGVAIVGLAVLLIANRAELDEHNALPVPQGDASLHLYRELAQRRSRLRPEERLADAAGRAEFFRLGYIAKTVGWSLFLLGINLFAFHGLD